MYKLLVINTINLNKNFVYNCKDEKWVKKIPNDFHSGWISKKTEGYLVLQVDKPKMVYNGQKLIRLVAKNTPPRTKSTRPNVPLTVPVKYNAANTAAKMMRTTLSADPMFFFMIYKFRVVVRNHEDIKTFKGLAICLLLV